MSFKKSTQDWHFRSGGRISRRRFLRLRERFWFAAAGVAAAVMTDVSGTVSAPAASEPASTEAVGSAACSTAAASPWPSPCASRWSTVCWCLPLPFSTPLTFSGTFGSGRTPAASWACLVQVHVPSQFSVLQGICRSSSSPISFAQISQYCG
ncbi:MAG: hypothetical protein ABUS79_13525 [Pseudomonadota bacterium]